MMKKLLATAMLYGMTAFPFLDGTQANTQNFNQYDEITKVSNLEEIIKEVFNQKMAEQSSDEIATPYYNLKSNRCSQYALLSAKKLFDIDYKWEDAWNLRYSNEVVHKFGEGDSINGLVLEGKLEPGMILGVDQPYSSYKNHIDKSGEKVQYTHVILYLGLNDEGRPEFVNQFGRNIERITDKDFENKEFIVKEVIGPSENKGS